MAKLTWKALQSTACIVDPALHGEGYHLRYRRRKGGTYAELRYKMRPGEWKSYRLGRIDDEQGARLRIWGTASWSLLEQVGRLDDVAQAQLATSPVPVERALEPIRKRAQELLGQLMAGQDPRGGPPRNSLRALIDRYLRDRAPGLRPRTRLESERHLLKHWAPLHHRPAAEITKGEIADRLFELKRESGPVAALRSRATLRAMYNWAFDADLVPHGPAAFFPSKNVIGHKEQSRDRVLSLAELRDIWTATEEPGDHNVIVRVLLLTGQRREEVGGMRWSELDLEAGLWHLPAERTKNGRPHLVPLSRQAVELLRAVERKPDRDNLFGNGNGSYSGWSRSKRRLTGRSKIESWTLHDLRRSFQTRLVEDAEHEGLEIDPHIADAILNHVGADKAGVQGVYNRASYRRRAAAAMQAWADFVTGTQPAQVIPLRA